MRVRHRGASNSPRDPRGRQSGETLIELIITVILLSTAILAIVAGLLTLTQTTTLNRATTEANVLAQSYAEQLEQPINPTQSPGSNSYYAACVPGQTAVQMASNYNVAPYKYTGNVPTGWAVQVVYVETLPSSIGNGSSFGNWTNKCLPSGDTGMQRIYIQAYASFSHASKEQVVIVKRNAACPALQLTPTTSTTLASQGTYPDATPC